MGEKAENTHPIVEADNNDSLSRQFRSVVQGIGRRTADKRSPVDEHHHWAARTAVVSGSPDVGGQTVLAGLLTGGNHIGRLHAVGAKASRVPLATPRKRPLRRTPAQRANRRCSVRDSLECQDSMTHLHTVINAFSDHVGAQPDLCTPHRSTARANDQIPSWLGGPGQSAHQHQDPR